MWVGVEGGEQAGETRKQKARGKTPERVVHEKKNREKNPNTPGGDVANNDRVVPQVNPLLRRAAVLLYWRLQLSLVRDGQRQNPGLL